MGDFYNSHICEQLWNQPQINVDGRVLGCCVNSWAEFGGNAFEDLVGALNSKKLKASRRALMGLADMPKESPCARCSYYLTRKEHEIWVEPGKLTKWLRRAARDLVYGNLRVGPKPKAFVPPPPLASIPPSRLVTIETPQESSSQE